MSCKQNQQALIEAAARGAELPAGLREHLGVCSVCHAVFVRENALFDVIGTHLREKANAESPVGFLHRVQARLTDEAPNRRTWSPAWAAVTALLVFVLGSAVARNIGRNVRAPSIASNSSSQGTVSLAEGHAPALQPSIPSTTAPRRIRRGIPSSVRDLDFHPQVSSEQRRATEQLILRIQRGEIDGNVLVSSTREELAIPPIVIPPITATPEGDTPSEPAGSSRISVPERPVDTK